MKNEQSGLPVVSMETLERFYAVGEENQSEYGKSLSNFRDELFQENPNLCAHIEAELQNFPVQLRDLVAASIVSTLYLLSQQAQVDNMRGFSKVQ